MKNTFFTILFSLIFSLVFSQEETPFLSDTTVVDTTLKHKKSIFKKGHDPSKAALFSAIIPGAGQIYNKKYWKAPIVLAGVGGLAYWLGYNVYNHTNYTKAYRRLIEDETAIVNYKGYTTENELYLKRRETKQMLDISAIALGVWYILNIVDATVDAHLIDFDVNDDISISFRPDVRLDNSISLSFEKNIYSGVSIQMNFK